MPWVANRRLGLKTHACPLVVSAHAHEKHRRKWLKKWWIYIKHRPELKGSTNTMISSPLKPSTNAHTVCSRPTLNVFERFMKGSLHGLYDRPIYERTFLSEPVKKLKNHAISNAGRKQRTEGKIYTRNIQCLADVHGWICQKRSLSSRRYASCLVFVRFCFYVPLPFSQSTPRHTI